MENFILDMCMYVPHLKSVRVPSPTLLQEEFPGNTLHEGGRGGRGVHIFTFRCVPSNGGPQYLHVLFEIFGQSHANVSNLLQFGQLKVSDESYCISIYIHIYIYILYTLLA